MATPAVIFWYFEIKISQQVLPTAATLTPQAVLMAWRVAVICTERGTDIECYCVCCEGLAEGSMEILRKTMNYGPDTLAKQKIHAVCTTYVHIFLSYKRFPLLTNDNFTVVVD